MVSAGPFPASLIVLVVAISVAALVGAGAARRMAGRAAHIVSLILDMALVGVVGARVGFVLAWLPQYASDPFSILRIGDGGFTAWIGTLAAIGYAAWRTRQDPALRRPIAYGAVAGLVAWLLLGELVQLTQRSAVRLPQSELLTLDGGAASLGSMVGKPLVVNLWATWCPPCRREMPVLTEAQSTQQNVTFAFVNQGEDAERIARYLQAENLQPDNVLLDGLSSVSQQMGTHGLPTTLFFDSEGRLVGVHLGELTEASLAHKLRRLGNADGKE